MHEDELDLLPWEQQPNEPPRAYHVFEIFCHLGPERSVRAAAVKWFEETKHPVPPNPGMRFNEIARRWRWQERADCYWRTEMRRAERLLEGRRDAIYKRMAMVGERALERLVENGLERVQAERWGKDWATMAEKIFDLNVRSLAPVEERTRRGRPPQLGDLPAVEDRLRPDE